MENIRKTFKLSVIQLNSNSDINNNINKVFSFLNKSLENKPNIISLPEVFSFIGDIKEKLDELKSIYPNIIEKFKKFSKENKVYIVAGSIHEPSEEENKFYNTSFVFSPLGEIISSYRKIHLFDVNINENNCFRESDVFKAGSINQLPIIITPYGKIGLSICYDLRLSNWFTKLRKSGAEIIFLPSAFTKETGKSHWEILTRARAIENQLYMICPNQVGNHGGNRESYGHSMIIDPWGKIISNALYKEGIISSEINIELVNEIRRKIPISDYL
jgi:predicted amidohydrolase